MRGSRFAPAAESYARARLECEGRGLHNAGATPLGITNSMKFALKHTASRRTRRAPSTRARLAVARLCIALAALSLLVAAAPLARAQRRVSREYPAPPNVRLHLHNRSGTVEVIAWDKNKVRVSATMESSSAKMTPEVDDDGVRIDVRRENREDVGDINFKIQVPVDSTVDISTMRGNITIRNVRGQMVRAHVSSEGDIELTGIRAMTVMAENTVGNILFDAELLRGGTYVLNSTQGDIQLRITAEAGFRLMAVAPRTRNINLNSFAEKGQFEFINEKRRVVGKVGEGGASLSTTNGRGSIVFMPR